MSWQIICQVWIRFCLINVRICELKSFLMISNEWNVNPNDSMWLIHWTLKLRRPNNSRSDASFFY